MISRPPVEYPVGKLSSLDMSDMTKPWIDWSVSATTAINALLSGGSGAVSHIPVGGVYISTTDTNPATTLGYGTWTPIKGRFLVGVDSGDSDFTPEGKTGGSKTIVI